MPMRVWRWFQGAARYETKHMLSDKDKQVDDAILDLQAQTGKLTNRVQRLEEVTLHGKNPFSEFADRVKRNA